MKKILFIFLLLISITTFAQIQNIADLSTGVHERSAILKDSKENVIGYAFVFNKGLINDSKNQQFEYVILDKNLNKITNGTYELSYHKKIIPKIESIVFNNQNLYIVTHIYENKYLISAGQVVTSIDLKSNTFTNKLNSYEAIYHDDEIDFDYMSKLDYKSYYSIGNYLFINNGKENVHLVSTQINKLDVDNAPMNNITFYDQDFNKKYEYYLDADKKKDYYSFLPKTIKGDKTVIWQRKSVFDQGLKLGIDRLLTYDINTGELLSNVVYNSKSDKFEEFIDPNVELLVDKMFVIGEIKYTPQHYIGKYQSKPSLGIKRNIYDTKGEVLLEKKTYYQDIFTDIKFKNGRDNKGFKFLMTEYFNFNDNSFSVLLAKEKGDGHFVQTKTTDFIVVNFDKDGNYTNHILLEKSKEYYDTYLFSQENKEENEVLFFYQENLKEDGKKNYYLVINRLKDGKLTQMKMPFKTESSYLRFSKAEYGSILITEYNKDDKESSIRIEKLNFE